VYGLVALLDPGSHARVEALWEELSTRFGVHGLSLTPVPHFSFHVAESYDFDALTHITAAATAAIPVFNARTNGLGIFTGARPVLYIPVTRTPALTMLHHRLWDVLSAVAVNPVMYYHPDQWRPHITLAHGDVDHDTLAEIIRLLSARSFLWDLRVDTLAVLAASEPPERTIIARFPLHTPS
jgi:2'-5' RNA ligase